MSWLALAQVGMSIAGSLSGAAAEKANVRAQNTVNSAQAAAANLMRGANNELLSKRNSLARYVQNENNRRLMTQTGREAEAALINYRRARDAADTGDFEEQIRFSEQAGEQAAMSGASGLTGGVADIVASTSALRLSRIKQATLTATKQADWDAQRMQGDILMSGLNSLDQSFIVDDLDYSLDTHVDQKPSKSTFGAVLQGVFSNSGATLSSAAGSASGFFNTPSYNAFADRAGAVGSGSGGRSRTITGGR